MDYEIMLQNCLVLTIAFYIIVSVFLQQRIMIQAAYFSVIFFILYVFMVVHLVFGMRLPSVLICCVVSIFFVNMKLGNWLKSIHMILSVTLFIQVVVNLLGSFVFFILPTVDITSFFYNIVIEIGLLGCVVILRFYKSFFFPQYDNQKLLMFNSIYKASFVILISTVLSVFPNQVPNYVLLYFFLFIVMTISLFHMKHVTKLDNDIRQANDSLTRQHIESDNINKRYNEIITTKHYYIGLYKSTVDMVENGDIQGLREYYRQYIAPVHEQLQTEKNNHHEIDRIQIVLLKARMIEMINTVSQLPHINLYIRIGNIISDVHMKDIDLFTVVNIFIDNAVEETCQQKSGEIKVFMTKTHAKFIFRIENSLQGHKSVPKPHNSHKGLEIVKQIADQYPNVNIVKCVELNAFIQTLEVVKD